MSRRAVDYPVVYGSPARIEVLLDSITRVIEGEPDEVFDNAAVRQSGRQLSAVIDRRVTPRDLRRTCEWLIRCLQTEGAVLAAGAETEAALVELRTVIGDVLGVR